MVVLRNTSATSPGDVIEVRLLLGFLCSLLSRRLEIIEVSKSVVNDTGASRTFLGEAFFGDALGAGAGDGSASLGAAGSAFFAGDFGAAFLGADFLGADFLGAVFLGAAAFFVAEDLAAGFFEGICKKRPCKLINSIRDAPQLVRYCRVSTCVCHR